VALPMINAQRHLIGLLPVTTGARYCGGVELHPHALNTSTDIARELNTIGVDNRKANRTTVNVVRVRRTGCGTRYLVLRFAPDALKPKALKNKGKDATLTCGVGSACAVSGRGHADCACAAGVNAGHPGSSIPNQKSPRGESQ
jgi:hypothetical protein